MNKTLAGQYEGFKERMSSEYNIQADVFRLLTVAMEDNAKKDAVLKRLHQQYSDPRSHYSRADDIMRELIEQTLTETSPEREIEL